MPTYASSLAEVSVLTTDELPKDRESDRRGATFRFLPGDDGAVRRYLSTAFGVSARADAGGNRNLRADSITRRMGHSGTTHTTAI